MLPDSVETNSESMHDAVFKAAVDIVQSLPKKGCYLILNLTLILFRTRL